MSGMSVFVSSWIFSTASPIRIKWFNFIVFLPVHAQQKHGQLRHFRFASMPSVMLGVRQTSEYAA
jgi:hypothetical protein